MDLIDAMRTTHSCRYFTADQVPNHIWYDAIEAARFAPQGGNRQPVQFLIVTDSQKKKLMADVYMRHWTTYKEALLKSGVPMDAIAAANDFAENFSTHPAVVVVCADLSKVLATDKNLDRLSIVGGASVYPMVHNFCLALRSFGVGTSLTTLLCEYEPQMKELLGIPEHLSTAAYVVAGYPAKPFPKKLRRGPVEGMAFLETFDSPLNR